MSNADEIINFLNSNFGYNKEELFKKFNIDDNFLENNNEYKTCFGNVYKLFKFFYLYKNEENIFSIKEYKKIKNKKLLVVKMPEQSEMEDIYRFHIYSFEDTLNAINLSLTKHNPELSAIFSTCNNFKLLDLMQHQKIPQEAIESLLYFSHMKNNIDNF